MTPYTPEELDRLEALAKAATPGPWRESGRNIDQLTDAGKGYPLDVYPDSKEIAVSNWSESGTNGILTEADAAHIAAFNPAVVLRLLAQVRAAEWQPIATAPKDGAAVLLFEPGEVGRHDGIALVGGYVDFDKYDRVPHGYHSGWFDTVNGYYEITPTHWQPLPPPPARREGSAEVARELGSQP